MTANVEIDLKQGIYRRFYSCWLTGRRVNAISPGAEMWLMRLTLIADDYGNFHADPLLLCQLARGRRVTITTKQSEKWIGELVGTVPPLVRLYTVGTERYGSILEWEGFQPAGKNGRRVRKCPGESGGIQDNPGVTVPNRVAPPAQSGTEALAGTPAGRVDPAGSVCLGGDLSNGSVLAGWLDTHGVGEPAATDLASAGLRIIDAERLWVRSRTANNPVGAFVAAAQKLLGIHKADKSIGGTVNGVLAKANANLHRARENHRRTCQ